MNLKYIAGLFDGEGTVFIDNWRNGKSYSLRCQIINTNLGVLEEIQEEVGGKINAQERDGNRQNIYGVFWNGIDAFNFLNKIYPFTIIKNREIEEALKFPLNENRNYISDEGKREQRGVFDKVRFLKMYNEMPKNYEISLEYIAGFFDGEGYIGVSYLHDKYYILKCQFTNTNKEILEIIQSKLGGDINKSMIYDSKRIGKCDLTFYSQNCKIVIEKMLQHLIIKKDQVEVALEFHIGKSGVKLDKDEEKDRKRIYNKLKELKRPFKKIPQKYKGLAEKEHEEMLKKKEKAVKMCKENPNMSVQEIGEKVGVSGVMISKYLNGKERSKKYKLSPERMKEKEVIYEKIMNLRKKGLNNTQIGESLKISSVTVSNYISRKYF